MMVHERDLWKIAGFNFTYHTKVGLGRLLSSLQYCFGDKVYPNIIARYFFFFLSD